MTENTRCREQKKLLRRPDHAAQSGRGAWFVERSKAYIQERYADYEFSLSELLEHLGISKSYFCVLFKSETGMTFTEYVNHLRIEQAKQLLQNTNLYTHEIATRIGFLDANYFSMTFKRIVGVTPKQYRRQND